jgi:predicted alpha/beta hydrolase family esterase
MSLVPHPLPFTRVLVVHGFGAAPEDHWFPWLKEEVPQTELLRLPHPHQPRATEWIPLVAQAIGRPDPGLAVVTHSLGGLTALRAIEQSVSMDGSTTPGPAEEGARLGAFIAVAPFDRMLPLTGDAELYTFIETDLSGFLSRATPTPRSPIAEHRHVIRSDDDPVVPAAFSDRFALDLDATTHVVPGAQHFLGADGVTRLPLVLRALGTEATP